MRKTAVVTLLVSLLSLVSASVAFAQPSRLWRVYYRNNMRKHQRVGKGKRHGNACPQTSAGPKPMSCRTWVLDLLPLAICHVAVPNV